MADLPDAETVAYLKQLHDLEAAGERTTLALGPWTAFVMIGALQLATRHPQMTPDHRALIGQVIDGLRPWFDGTPGEALLRLGDDPAYDQ
jgi:hypothetical protein